MASGDDKSTDEKSQSLGGMVADQAKELVTAVYNDGLKPVVSEVGSTAGNAANLALSPLNGLIDLVRSGGTWLWEKATKRREKSRVPRARWINPPADIFTKAAVQCGLLGDGDDVSILREMFAKLVATTMDANTARLAHPAFVSMLEQMSPDDARLLAGIKDPKSNGIGVAFKVRYRTVGNASQMLAILSDISVWTNADEGMRQEISVANLARLGILDLVWDATLNSKGGQDLRHSSLAKRIHDVLAGSIPPGAALELLPGVVSLNPFGTRFHQACVAID